MFNEERQCIMAHACCMLDKQGNMQAGTCTHTHTHTHTHKCVILIAFPRQHDYANAPHCYVIPTFRVLVSPRLAHY
jgi:hypothetical protein